MERCGGGVAVREGRGAGLAHTVAIASLMLQARDSFYGVVVTSTSLTGSSVTTRPEERCEGCRVIIWTQCDYAAGWECW